MTASTVIKFHTHPWSMGLLSESLLHSTLSGWSTLRLRARHPEFRRKGRKRAGESVRTKLVTVTVFINTNDYGPMISITCVYRYFVKSPQRWRQDPGTRLDHWFCIDTSYEAYMRDGYWSRMACYHLNFKRWCQYGTCIDVKSAMFITLLRWLQFTQFKRRINQHDRVIINASSIFQNLLQFVFPRLPPSTASFPCWIYPPSLHGSKIKVYTVQ